MKVFTALVLLAVEWPLATWASAVGCLCTYGQSCWPSASTFSQLQSQVSQPLIYPLPSASACYPPSHPSGDCATVLTNWDNGTWRSSLPGAMEAPNFETFTFPNGTINACYQNTTFTDGVCGQGSMPVISVDARSVEDIQAAVNFVVEQNLKFVVKNTGHDYLGRSTARGSFVIWTHNMKNIMYNPAFVPQGAPASAACGAVTLGAGVQWQEAYAAVNNSGRLMIGGSPCGHTVGSAGGWLAGGGHSAISPKYGLGVDNAIKLSVILSTGEFLTVNEYQFPDLFWALCGGGGFTYGIVTSVTYRTYPSVPCQLYTYQANATNSSAAQELVAGLLRYQTQFTDDGWGGYATLGSQQLSIVYFGPNMTNETAVASTQGWRNFTATLTPFGVVSTEEIVYSLAWYNVYQSMPTTHSTGPNIMLVTRLLTQDTLANKSVQLAEIILANCTPGSLDMVAGGRVSQFAPDSAGLNPVWREAITQALCGNVWEDGSSLAEIQAVISQLKALNQAIYNITPNDGAYFNEASLFEIDFRKTFFGSHYAALKGIKEVYDPYNVFVIAEGVGSEDWNEDLMCRI